MDRTALAGAGGSLASLSGSFHELIGIIAGLSGSFHELIGIIAGGMTIIYMAVKIYQEVKKK